MTKTRAPWRILLAVLAIFALGAAACGSDDSSSSDSSTTEGGSDTTAAPDDSTTTAPAGGDLEPVGAACSQIPADGEGSGAGMADDPVGTAASNNPLLKTLVKAVTEAGLVDTLNDASAKYTVFAPIDPAFAKIPEADLTALLADKEMLTKVLSYHVYAGERLDIAQLTEMGTLDMLAGGSTEIEADGDTFKINGESTVVCGNVTTANATVHLIDTVLTPAE